MSSQSSVPPSSSLLLAALGPPPQVSAPRQVIGTAPWRKGLLLLLGNLSCCRAGLNACAAVRRRFSRGPEGCIRSGRNNSGERLCFRSTWLIGNNAGAIPRSGGPIESSQGEPMKGRRVPLRGVHLGKQGATRPAPVHSV